MYADECWILYAQGLLGIEGYPDGAIWDMTSVPFHSATAGCGLAVAGGCPSCSAALLLFSPEHNAFVVDHTSNSWTDEISSLLTSGSILSALSSWSMAGRLFVGATVSISSSEHVGWNWTSSVSENMVQADALAIFEYLETNHTLVRSSGFFSLTQEKSNTVGALIGPITGTAGRASYTTLSTCNVSVLIVPTNVSTFAYQILPAV